MRQEELRYACLLCGGTFSEKEIMKHKEEKHQKEWDATIKKDFHRFKSGNISIEEVRVKCKINPFLSFSKSSKGNLKRVRFEKIISVREFLTGEHRTNADLPRNLEIISPMKKDSCPIRSSDTRRYFGSGKRPRWLDDTPKRR